MLHFTGIPNSYSVRAVFCRPQLLHLFKNRLTASQMRIHECRGFGEFPHAAGWSRPFPLSRGGLGHWVSHLSSLPIENWIFMSVGKGDSVYQTFFQRTLEDFNTVFHNILFCVMSS